MEKQAAKQAAKKAPIQFPEKVSRELLDEKSKLEKKGWKFEHKHRGEPYGMMWSATRGDEYIGDHAYLTALLNQMLGRNPEVKSQSEEVDEVMDRPQVKSLGQEPKTIVVDASRLAPKGDIRESYSADKIANNQTVSKPFEYDGNLWINTGGVGKGDYYECEAYKLIPESHFSGEVTTYGERRKNWRGAESVDLFYDRVRVSYKKIPHVLLGPKLKFIPPKPEIDTGIKEDAEALRLAAELEKVGWTFVEIEKDNFNASKHFAGEENPVHLRDGYTDMRVLVQDALKTEESKREMVEKFYAEQLEKRRAALFESGWHFSEGTGLEAGFFWAEKKFENLPDATKIQSVRGLERIISVCEDAETTYLLTQKANELPVNIIENLRVELSDAEVLERNRQLTNAMNKKDAEIARFATEKQKHTSNVKLIESDILKFRNACDTRSEWRDVECKNVYDLARGMVDIFRKDTGGKVRSRKMTPEELQKNLFK